MIKKTIKKSLKAIEKSFLKMAKKQKKLIENDGEMIEKCSKYR